MRPSATLILCFALVLCLMMRPQGVLAQQSTTAGIHAAFKDQLKAAAQGKPTDTDAISDTIRLAVERQIEIFAEQAKLAADENAMQAARQASDSMELTECLVDMLSCELRNEELADMESRAIRQTLAELDIQVRWDYSLATPAIPPDKTTVRIRLPKLHPCGGCKKTLEKALDGTPGLGHAIVDLETQTAEALADIDLEVEQALAELEQTGLPQLADWKLIRK